MSAATSNVNVAPKQKENNPRLEVLPGGPAAAARPLEWAYKYAELGLAVIPLCPLTDHKHYNPITKRQEPCPSPGKRPMKKGWREWGVPTNEDIDNWLTDPLCFNIGLVLGNRPGRTGLIRIDPDGEEGLRRLAEYERIHGPLPKTWTFRRGKSMGYIFATPAELTLRKHAQPGAGKHEALEFLGEGQQTVIPPSVHPSGDRYEWLPGCSPWDMPAPAMAPRWIIDLMAEEQKPDLRVIKGGAVGAEIDDEAPPADANLIRTKCRWFAECIDKAATLAEPAWYAFLSVVGRCADGERLAHEWSAPHPGYNEGETQAKLEHALTAAGPVLCARVEREFAPELCRECPHRGAISSPINLGSPKPTDDRPIVVVTGNLAATTGRALDVLAEANKPAPFIFVRAATLSRVTEDEKGQPIIQQLSESALRGVLARTASFQEYRGKDRNGNPKYVEINPPMSVVKDIMALPRWDFPRLESVTQVPILRPDGTIVNRPGYDPATGVYLKLAPGLEPALAIPDQITQEDAQAARRFIEEELLGDFPFVDQPSKANALGLMITMVVRAALGDARVLMALIDAPRQGTGKSLLVKSILIFVTGNQALGVMNAPEDEEEWRKQITAQLLRGASAVVIDNVIHPLGSAALAVAISERVWEDRILGQTKTISLPCNTIWTATGNNIRLRGDLPRRCYWIRLNAGVPRPWERTNFRHPDLLAWTRAHRGELLAAALKMARAWFLAGCPPAKGVPVVGGFNEWAQMVGGILAFSGVEGFLGNLSAMHDALDEETPQWQAFIGKWYEVYKSTEITVAELIADLRGEDAKKRELREVLPDELAEVLPKEKDSTAAGRRPLEEGDGASARKFGRRLGAKKDVVYGPYNNGLYGLKLEQGTMRQGRATWKVTPVWPQGGGDDDPDCPF